VISPVDRLERLGILHRLGWSLQTQAERVEYLDLLLVLVGAGAPDASLVQLGEWLTRAQRQYDREQRRNAG